VQDEAHAGHGLDGTVEGLHTAILHAEALIHASHAGHNAHAAGAAASFVGFAWQAGSRATQLALPLLGGCLVAYITRKYLRHAVAEWRGSSFSATRFFLWLLAAICGLLDVSAHAVHVLSMTAFQMDHALVEQVEWYGIACAVVAAVSAVVAEMIHSGHAAGHHHATGGAAGPPPHTTDPTLNPTGHRSTSPPPPDLQRTSYAQSSSESEEEAQPKPLGLGKARLKAD